MFVALAAITAAVAGLILLAVPERGGAATVESLGQQVGSLLRIFRDRTFWRLAPLLATTAGSHIAIQTLWAGPWFRDVAGLDRLGVANYLMLIAIAFLIGILLSGAVADWFVRRGVDLLTVMLGFLMVFLVAELLIVLQWTALNPLMWLLFGMLGQVAILAYPWLSSHYGATLSGRATTAMNLVIFLAAFAVQYAIGGDHRPVPADRGAAAITRWPTRSASASRSQPSCSRSPGTSAAAPSEGRSPPASCNCSEGSLIARCGASSTCESAPGSRFSPSSAWQPASSWRRMG